MAGGAFEGDENEEITGINVTPLVDVMLVLLIIFMVTTSYVVSHSLDLTLPQAESGEAHSEGEEQRFSFELTRDSELFLNGEKITWELIPEKIAQVKATLPPHEQLQALISADKSITHGLVINLIDIVRKNGITNFAINVEAHSNATP